MGSQSCVSWDPDGVFWLTKKELTVSVWSAYQNAIRSNGLGLDIQRRDEILLQVSLKSETKIDGRGHEMFSQKITGPWKI